MTVDGQTSYQPEKKKQNKTKKQNKKNTQNVSEIIVYNLYQRKRFFVDVTLKSSMTHLSLMTFGYFATFSSSKRHPNSYLVAHFFSVIAIFLGTKGHLREKLMTLHRRFERC